MRRSFLVILFTIPLVMYPFKTNAITIPCSLILEPVDANLTKHFYIEMIFREIVQD